MVKQRGSIPSEGTGGNLAKLVESIHAQCAALRRNLEQARASQARAVETLQALERKLSSVQPPPEVAQIITRIGSRSAQQRRVFEKVIAGESNKAIAFDLRLSQKTVETHRARVMKKLQATSLAQLVRIASKAGRGNVVARTGGESRAGSRSA
jgi:DNA-binding NarL/FixJ family response regulator